MWFKTQNSGPIKLSFANLNERFAAVLRSVSPQWCSVMVAMRVKVFKGAFVSYEPRIWALLKIGSFFKCGLLSVVLSGYKN